MTRAEMKARAKEQLGGGIFTSKWMMGLLAVLITGAITSVASAIIPYVGSFIITGPMTYGITYVFLKQARDNEAINLGDLFKAFNSDFVQYLLLGLMISIFTALWSLLFVIPGIIKAYSYSMAYYIKVDHPEWGWKECIDESRRIMDGHKMELFVLHLSFIGWAIVGALLCGIGELWVVPYMNATQAQFYESIR